MAEAVPVDGNASAGLQQRGSWLATNRRYSTHVDVEGSIHAVVRGPDGGFAGGNGGNSSWQYTVAEISTAAPTAAVVEAGGGRGRGLRTDENHVNRDYWGELDSVSRVPRRRDDHRHHRDDGEPAFSREEPVRIRYPVRMGESGQMSGPPPRGGQGAMEVKWQYRERVNPHKETQSDRDGWLARRRGLVVDGRDQGPANLIDAVVGVLEAAPSGENCDEISGAVRTSSVPRISYSDLTIRDIP